MFTDLESDAPKAAGAAPADPGLPGRSWFDLAHALARTGGYRGVDEVEAALVERGILAAPARSPIVRDAIDIACARARGEV